MDVQERLEARGTRGCRCCGTTGVVLLLAVALLLWFDYLRVQRLTRELDPAELQSTAQVEEYIEKQDIKVKKEDGDWKADFPWKQPLVDELRQRFDSLAKNERLAEAQQRADESARALRRLLEETPQDLGPYLTELKEKLAWVKDRETVREAIDRLARLDPEWLDKESERLLQSPPGENIELYIEKLQALFDNTDSAELRRRLREAIDAQMRRLQRSGELGALPEIDPRTGELPLVLEYMVQQKESREPVDWSFVREVELDDGPAYSVTVRFADGSRTNYYIRAGKVLRSAAEADA